MPLLDVSDVLMDTDFLDVTLVCERNTQAVSAAGIASNVVEEIPFTGVVTSAKGDVLERRADGERVTGSITIHSMFELQDGGQGFTADIVQWGGRRYTVSSVNDYSTYGRGFVAANCDLIPLAG